MVEKLEAILKSIGENVKGNNLTLKMNSSMFYEILQEKELEYIQFREDIKRDWEDFKQKNLDRIIKKTYSTFFYQFFHKYFKTYLDLFCGLDKKSLQLNLKEKVSEENLFLEYTYLLYSKE
ncbi:MAG: hypothetical protein EAX89_08595 [Candidatus Lokiarchaeota archaeon]|nr:hypothetical protein [Candidatus Lokiarchaeota archaeon]